MGAIKKPTFLDVLGKSVNSALAARGLNTPTTQTIDPDVQSGILYGILDIIRNPFFQQVVSTIVDMAFGMQTSVSNVPVPDAQDSKDQLERVLLSAIIDTITEAIASRGVNPQVALGKSIIQQGIVSGVAGVLKDPNFKLVVGHVIDAALQEHGVQKLQRSLQKPTPAGPVQYGLSNSQLKVLTTLQTDIASQPDVQRALLSLAGNLSVDTLVHGFAPAITANQYTNGTYSGLFSPGNGSTVKVNTLLQPSVDGSSSPANGIASLANGFGGNGIVNSASRSGASSLNGSNNLGNGVVNGLLNSTTPDLAGYPLPVKSLKPRASSSGLCDRFGRYVPTLA
ncbi:hypothetical protein H0H92_002757 [Tricholoma furcatifolium]|nr:hypothetical protein H0H92_002757 [Tricholoma furcatifolium]